MKKVLLCHKLTERSKTVEFRKIRKQLYVVAENKKNSYLLPANTDQETLMMLENEGLTLEKIEEYGFKKIKISW